MSSPKQAAQALPHRPFATALLLLLANTTALAATPSATAPSTAEWAGQGSHRIWIHVDTASQPRPRPGDEGPAEVALDFDRLLAPDAPNRRPDLTTLQVIRHDPTTGKPVPVAKFAYGKSKLDVPWRWYDDAIGYDFPEFQNNIDRTNGKLTYVRIPRFGYFYDCLGDGRSGRLVFMHRHTDPTPARYAVYFDLLPDGAEPNQPPPRAWLGDGLNRCDPVGSSSTGLIHSRVEVADWNGDGLFDLIVGSARGGVVWYPNRGRLGYPSFPVSRLVKTADGLPLDVGWSAAPRAVDWDADGRIDLLTGAEWNRVLLYRNGAANAAPSLVYDGMLHTPDGKPLMVPWEPSPETEKFHKYTVDYYTVLDTADWDDDGDIDLLAGGYVTGRIYLFENTAGKGKRPVLRMVGPIEADGEPVDVGWAAAPTVADLDDDGDLDLISGCMPMTPGGGDSASSENFLHYFRNDGTRAKPRLHKTRLPRKGEFPCAALGTPRLIDWTADGLLDLVVSAGTQIYLYRNVGTRRDPLFEAHANPLPSTWGNSNLPGTRFVDPDRGGAIVPASHAVTARGIWGAAQLIDWNRDGLVDVAEAPCVFINAGQGNPGLYHKPFSVLPDGQEISHLSGIGDDWRFVQFYDLDADGRTDLMDADHSGHFWWHRNRGSNDKFDVDVKGVRLILTDGKPASVGQGMQGFDALQGARATYTAGDFDGDGLPDLVAANALGVVRFFRQTTRQDPANPPTFAPAVQIGQLPTRAACSAVDWNADGKLDVVVGSGSDATFVFLGRRAAGGPPFEPAQRLALPSAPYGTGAPITVGDVNGDGDPDVVLQTAYGYQCLYEHTFIAHGYTPASVISSHQEKRR
ncbi:MAG: VCBS repeat-containing protein [Phycisphaerae bacterium]|nr:VCBS repeat-containing protein [Phycisphaerae bacterium]